MSAKEALATYMGVTESPEEAKHRKAVDACLREMARVRAKNLARLLRPTTINGRKL